VDEKTYWLAWSHLPRTGTSLLRRLQARFGSLEVAWAAAPEDLDQVEGIGPQILEGIVAGRTTLDPEQHRQQLEARNPVLLTPLDADYPSLLREIPSQPATLFDRGRLGLLQNSGNRAIAVVGTRNPSDYGHRWTRRLAQRLAEAGFLIVSGLAEGIDTEAHCAALDEGADTIAVLGRGVDLAYPRGNLNFHRAIAPLLQCSVALFNLSDHRSCRVDLSISLLLDLLDALSASSSSTKAASIVVWVSPTTAWWSVASNSTASSGWAG
jgi:DNA processing protein